MPVDKLKPNDPRVESLTALIRGKTYHYLHAKPWGVPRATILLVHGWPDLAFGWRHQVPFLLSLGLRVVVPDMLGYGGSDAPQDLAPYSLRSVCDDLAELVRHVQSQSQSQSQSSSPQEGDENNKIILGGHDWGGMVVWRFALWHPALLRGVFSVCTPYVPPSPTYHDLAATVARLPNFRYQLQLAGPDVEREVGRDPAKLRGFLAGMYGARGPNGGEVVFSVDRGVHFENLGKVGASPLLGEDELAFYVRQYARTGVRGPLNWYRTRRINYEEELALLGGEGGDGKGQQAPKVVPPALMIVATKDAALPPSMAEGMGASFESLRMAEVEGSHWALWEPTAEQTNGHIGKFVEELLGGGGGAVKASI